MRLGFYQCVSPAGSLNKALYILGNALSEAQAAGAKMLVMPELFMPGYNACTSVAPDGWADALEELRKLVRNSEIALTIGLPDYTQPHARNSAFVFGPDGEPIVSYDKIQLYGPREKSLFVRGNGYVTFDYVGYRIGLLICYDVEFPEHVRALARLGVQIVLVPTANMMPYTMVSDHIIRTRAAENGVSIAYVNYCGVEGDITYCGGSIIAGPDGSVLAKVMDGTELGIADVPSASTASPLVPYLDDLIVPAENELLR